MKSRPLISVALLLAAVGSSVLVWRLRQSAPPPPASAARSDYVLRDFELVMLDEDGSESFTVNGPYLQREPDGKSLSLREPRFAFPDQNKGRWHAQSALAWVGPKAQEVRLTKAVEFRGPKSEQGERLRFLTERLDIFPRRNLALSPDAVTVSQGDSILRGQQLRADMSKQRYQLKNIQGRYAPAHH